MTLSEFRNKLNEFYLGQEAKRISDAISLLSTAGRFFRKHLKNVDDVEFKSISGFSTRTTVDKRKDTLIKDYVAFNKSLKQAVTSSLQGQTAKGLDIVYNLLFSSNHSSVNIYIVDPYHDFYRMRATDNYELFDRKDMFAMPFQLSEKLDMARYNKQGYSCLYLANSLYLTWEEMRRPDISKTNFARFQNQKKLRLLDVTIPVKFKTRRDFVSAYLALVCCANVDDDKKRFKFEYLVSNMVLEAVIRANMENVFPLDGIRYISSKRFGSTKLEFDNQTELMYDFVFPSMDYKKQGHSIKLTNMFKLTKGRSLFLYNLHNIRLRRVPAMTTNYKDTIFYELEELSKLEPLDKIK